MNYSAPLPQSTQLHRTAIARRLWRRRGVLATAFFVVLLAGTAITFLITPVYYAFGTVVIGEQEPNNMSPAWTQRLGDPADLESQLLIARSRRMLRLALARPGMTETAIRDCHASEEAHFHLRRHVDCGKLEPDSQALVEYVEARYSVRALGRSRIISMGYQSVLPDAASILANGLLITYLEDQRAENARNREATAAWLLRESQRLDGELDKADASSSKPAEGTLSQNGIDQRKQFYIDLHRKVSDLEAERRTLVSSGRLVSLAEIPRLPYFPKRAPMLAATLAAATLLAGLAALRRDATDATARGASDVENATHTPVIAALPHLNARPRGLFGRFLSGRTRVAGSSTADAAVRKLLGRLTMSGERHLLVTSTTADEGKTSVALALANIAAALGEKVLLIDANLGRAAAAKRLGVTMRSGLTDILQGDCTLESVVVTTRAGFDVIPPGTRAGSYAARKPARDTLDGVMHSSASYDLVLIDGPAWDAGTEASRLAQAVDGVLWCARWGHTNLDELGAAVTEYRDEAGAARVLGIVFTSVDLGELQWFETGTRMSAKRVPRKLDDGPVDVQPRAPHAPERQ